MSWLQKILRKARRAKRTKAKWKKWVFFSYTEIEDEWVALRHDIVDVIANIFVAIQIKLTILMRILDPIEHLWCFQGVEKGCTGDKRVNTPVTTRLLKKWSEGAL